MFATLALVIGSSVIRHTILLVTGHCHGHWLVTRWHTAIGCPLRHHNTGIRYR